MRRTTISETSLLVDLLFDDPGAGRCLVAPDGSVQRVNAEWLRSTGLALNGVLGANIGDLFPEMRDLTLAMLARAGAGHRVEVPRHPHSVNGRETWWDGRIEPVPMKGGTGLLITVREGHGSAALGGADALPADEAMLRAILNATRESIWLFSADGVALAANEMALARWNRPAQEILGRSIAEYTPAPLGELRLAQIREVVRRGQPLSFEDERIGVRWEHTLYPLRSNGARIERVVVYSRDVTQRQRERRLAEEALRRYEVLASQARDIVLFIRSEDGRILEANAAALGAYGYERQELLSLSIADLRAPGTESLTQQQMAEAEAHGILFETVHRRKDGSIFPAEVSSRGATLDGIRTLISVVRDITERKRAEEALRESESTLRGILNATTESIWLFSVDGMALAANRTALERWGRPAYTIIGKHFHDFMPDEVGRSRLALIHEVARSGRPVQSEDCRAGIQFEHTYYPVFGADGRVERVATFSRDVTERKRAAEALRESERLLTDVIDASPMPVFLKDLDGRFLTVNKRLEDLLGLTREQLRGKTDYDLISKALADVYRAHDLKVIESGLPTTIEETAELVDGPHVYLNSKFPLIDAAGRVYGVGAISHDITERKRVETALRANEERLRQYAELLEHAPVLVRDGEDRIVVWNRGMELLYGWSRDEALGKVSHELLGTQFPLSRAEVDSQLTRTGSWEGELRHRRADGTEIVVASRQIVHRDAAGERRAVVEVNADVTALRRAEQALQEANEKLREADRRKNEFLAVLSHELRNPLAPIRNSLHLLHRATAGSDTARRAREVLQRQTDHLTRLVDDLLDLTRISYGKITLQLARMDARDVVRRACDDIRAVFEQRSVELRYSQPTEPTWVDADAARLAQMVGNLVTNALKFTQPGGQVQVAIRARGQACEISVRDTGTGIEQADLERIFEPFVQAGRVRPGAQSGLGIGLALVKDLAVKHGGSVRAESAGLGRGAEFILTLPLAAAPMDTARKVGVEKSTSSLSVLVIEDNEDAGLSLADLLGLIGHQVKVVGTGRAGLEAVSAHAPDVLICDLGLPDLSGYDVVRALRSAGSKVFAIALTGFAQPEDREQALEAGFDAHLAKPPPLDELDELLAKAAKNRVEAIRS